jgi:chemosensory pili system protein ChpA (sensor histidine kinase/response regulator)
LLKNILYYIATAKSSGKRVKQIKQAFKLEDLLPNSSNIDERYDSLRGSTQDLMKTVSAVIKEDLLHVKDQLDIFVRSAERTGEQLKPLEEQLRRIADTLAMLGLGDLRKIITDQVHNIENMQASGESPNDIALMEIASSLLYIESSLEGIEATKYAADEIGTSDTVLPAAEQKQLNKMVIAESAEVLAKVKESFNTYAVDPTQFNIIASTPEHLSQVRGVLSMLSFERAATLLQSATSYIAREIVQKQTQPNQAALDAIADVITSIEYYLEAIRDARLHPDSLLRVAEQSLTNLGYSITETEDAAEVAASSAQLAIPEEGARQAPQEQPLLTEPGVAAAGEELTPKIPAETQAEEISLPEEVMEAPAESLSEPAAEAALAEASDTGNLIVSVKDQLVDDVDEEILEIFIEEADEVLVVMKENLATWQNSKDQDALTILRRSYHTIKGSGRLAGATVVGEFAWAIENMLNRVMDGKLNTSPQLFAVLEQAQLGLEGLIKQLKGEAPTAVDPRPIAEYADAITNGESVPAIIPPLGQQAPAAEPQPTTDATAEEKAPAEEEITLAVEPYEFDEETPEFSFEEAPTEIIELVEVPAPESTLDEIFKKETAAHLANVKHFIEEFHQQENRFVTEPLMRALHTLHGSARMAEATHIAALSEALDRYFRLLHDSEQHISEAAIEVLRHGVEAITDMSDHSADSNYQPESLPQLLEHIAELQQTAKAAQTAKQSGSFSLHDEKADAELVSIFMEEAAEILGHIDTALNRWHSAMDDMSIVDEVQRSLHTLKGGARMANIKPVADLSHQLETVLEQVSEGQRTPDSHLLDLTQKCYDQLAQALDHLYMGQSVAPAGELIEQLQQYAAQLPQAEEIAQPESQGEPVVGETPISEQETVELGTLPEPEIPYLEEVSFTERPTEKINIGELDHELVSIFLEEADELHDDIDNTLDHWRSQPGNLSHVSELQRSLHTLKGGARMAGINAIADLSHAVETLLERITEKQLMPNDSHPHLVQRCQDWLSETIAAVKNNQLLVPAKELLVELEQAASGQSSDAVHAEEVEALRPEEPVEETTAAETTSEAASVEEQLPEEVLDEGLAAEELSVEELPIEEPFSAEIIQFETPVAEQPETEETETKEATEAFEETAFSVPEFAQAPKPSPEPETTSHEEYDEELVGIFLEEADEIQVNSEKTLHEWSTDTANRSHIAELQRALHTLKGGARMAGIKAIGDLSHAIESLLEAVTEGRLEPTTEFPKVVQTCHDWLSSAIEHVKQHAPLAPAGHLIQQLENLLAGKPAKEGLEEAAPVTLAEETIAEQTIVEAESAEETRAIETAELPLPAALEPAELVQLPEGEYAIPTDIAERLGQTAPRSIDEQIRVRADLIDHLVNYASETNIYNARIEQQLNGWSFNLTELKQTVQRLHEQLRKFEIETEAQIMYRHTEVSTEDDNFDPLELDRFSYMQQLSRGMVESLGDLTSIQNLLESISSDADVLLLQQSRVNNDLQEGLMRTRMTPFSNVLPRLRRIVRQTCEETGKEAGLNVIGAEGEMDRTQLNRIVPALEHILRNAVDHGLESPEERRNAGKSPEGHIEIRFSREGSEVVLRIVDDGAGINIPALRQKAIERGLITQDTKINDNELTEFILQSGFSTAKAVTQISGRGVGMDVVNTEIKQLNGSLHIETKQGQGSTFMIRLPLTVVVNQALMVNIHDHTYAIQMSNIEHVVRVRGDILNQMISGEMEHYDYAGFQYDALNLSQILHGVKTAKLDPKSTHPLLLGRSGEHRVAMQVEELLGRQEIVIKSLGPQLSTLNNVSGATILPDGQVALILDISTLIRSNMALQQIAVSEPLAEQPEVQHEEEKRPLVMIVDDSITVRKVTQRLLDRHNFDTLTAKDGVDALTVLLEQIPDIMLLDIEMPRMDGFELATAIRNDERLKNIPIIMITSRTGEKHRDRAMNIGVNMYLGKPYQEQELLDNIQSLLNNR